jgi:hypothetical protein
MYLLTLSFERERTNVMLALTFTLTSINGAVNSC